MKYIYSIILIIAIGLNSYSQHLRNPVDDTGNGLSNLWSDWGPRNDTSGSRFHAGLDYSPLPNGVAYALERGTPLLFSSQGYNSYIRVGRWTYMHVLIDSTGNNNWTLKDPVCSNRVLLETIGASGQTKIFVNDNNPKFLGVERTTKWGTPAITTQTVEANDIIFRPNSGNHLHLQTTEMGNWVNPLAYIAYNGSNSNNMTLSLRMKYNNGGVATEVFPNTNTTNVVYGEQVIVESDVNYVGEYDLNVSQVDWRPSGGSYSPLPNARWVYSGNGHLTFINRGDGIGTYPYFNSYPQRTDTQTRDLDDDILPDPREGMHPVLTGDHNMGRDILKRHWNTKQGWNTNTPAFPDGEYTLRLTTQDIRGNVCQNPATLTRIIDNFRPYIRKVEVRKGSVNGELAYRGEWIWQTASSSMTLQTTGSGCNTTDQVWVHVYPSEPIPNVTAKVNNTNCNLQSVNGSSSHYIFYVPANTLQNTNSLTISSTGTDLAGNPLFEIYQGTNTILSYSLPARNASGAWINNATGDDRAHQFGATQPGQYVCYMPPDTVSATVDQFQNVQISWASFGDGFAYRVYRSSMPSMAGKILISDGWITGNAISDNPPDYGLWYYAVEAYEFSTNKSATTTGCTLSESASVIITDPNASFYYDFGFDQSSLNHGRDVVFYVDVNNNIGYSYELYMDFGDGLTETISLYNGSGIAHNYPDNTGFQNITYNAICSLMVYNSSNYFVDGIELVFAPIQISANKPDLTLSITASNAPVMLGSDVTLTATLTGENPNRPTTWYWCVQSQPNAFTDCNFGTDAITPDMTTRKTSQYTKRFTSAGDYQVRVFALNDGRNTQYETYMVSVQNPGDDKVNCHIWAQYNVSATNIAKAGCKIRFRDIYPLGSGLLYPIGNFDSTCGVPGMHRDFYIEKFDWYINGTISSPQYVNYEKDGANFFLCSDNAEKATTFDYTPTMNDVGKTIEIKLIKTARPKHPTNSEWYGDEKCRIANTSIRTIYITDCDSYVEIKNSSDLSALLSQGSPVVKGSFNFNGSSQIHVSGNCRIIARKRIRIGSSVKINGTFKASMESCPLSNCNSFPNYGNCTYFKSESIEPDLFSNAIQSEMGMNLYPNPVCDFLNVDFVGVDLQKVSRLIIFDVSGKIVKRINPLDIESRIDVSELMQGSYFLSVHIDGEIITQKFVKE